MIRARSAESSRTYTGKGRILPTGVVEFVHQADAIGHVAADHRLRLPDRLAGRRLGKALAEGEIGAPLAPADLGNEQDGALRPKSGAHFHA